MEWHFERAYAKINLYLDIHRKREDGYHDLFTIMQLVNICDDVTITIDDSEVTTLSMIDSPIDIPMEKNIAYIAAEKFYENLDFKTKYRPHIKIVKRIPMAAGLSGGSADAAAVLRGLNYIYGKPYMMEDLCKLGATLGADVPFNIVGGAQLCGGRGEKMHHTYGIQNYSLVIACGDEKMSTAEQYKSLDKIYNNFVDYPLKDEFQQTHYAFHTGRSSKAFGTMYNIFETLYEDNETFKKIKSIMYANQAHIAMLSGSGSSIFGVFPDCLYAEDARDELAKEGIKSFLCKPINKTYEYILPNADPSR